MPAAVNCDDEVGLVRKTPNPANPKVCGTWLAKLLMRAFCCQASDAEDGRLLGTHAA